MLIAGPTSLCHVEVRIDKTPFPPFNYSMDRLQWHDASSLIFSRLFQNIHLNAENDRKLRLRSCYEREFKKFVAA